MYLIEFVGQHIVSCPSCVFSQLHAFVKYTEGLGVRLVYRSRDDLHLQNPHVMFHKCKSVALHVCD